MNLTSSDTMKAAQPLGLQHKSYNPIRMMDLPPTLSPSTQSDSCKSKDSERKPGNPGLSEFQTGSHLFRNCLPTFIVFHLFSPLQLIGQRPLVKERAQCCSNIKVTGGDLPCGASVRLTVTQFTDSQTTRDPCGSLLLLLLLFFPPTCQTRICLKMFFFF